MQCSFSVPNAKIFKIKAFLEANQVSLTLLVGTVLTCKLFENMQVISLYCFAVQQQSSTFTRQKFGFFDPKFSAEFIGLHFMSKKKRKTPKIA